MKVNQLILFILIFFVSCTKDSNNSSSPPGSDAIFQYKINGTLVKIANKDIASGEYVTFFKQLQGTIIPHTRYMFNGQKGANIIWVFGIQTDSLHVQTYIFDSTYLSTSEIVCTTTYNGQQSGLFYKGDNMMITITSYTKGLISGNFTAKFTPYGPLGSVPDYSTKGTVSITEGEFKNIKCLY